MLHTIQAFIFTITFISFSLADVFMTELADPQNSSDAGRFVELYNNGSSDVDLSAGWALQRWTNGNADPQSPKPLTGTISAGGFYIICNDADKFSATYGFACDQDIGTGGPADSNGDDIFISEYYEPVSSYPKYIELYNCVYGKHIVRR